MTKRQASESVSAWLRVGFSFSLVMMSISGCGASDDRSDASTARDLAVPDDAGLDAGVVVDDASPADVGTADAGSAADVGTEDAALDAARDASVDMAAMDAGSPAMCVVPPDRVGTGVCDYVPDVTFYDCAGNPVRVRSRCGLGVTYFYVFADWCPGCKVYARDSANDFYASYRAALDGFEMFFLVTQDTYYTVATAELCRSVRDAYDLTMPVLFDRDGRHSELGLNVNNDQLIVDASGRILLDGGGLAGPAWTASALSGGASCTP